MADETLRPIPDYTPDDWYWRKEDGSLYSSRRMILVGDGDAEFVEWLDGEIGRQPSIYPKDEDGQESVAELARVLSSTTAFASLLDYAKDRRWAKETGGIEINGLVVATDDRSKTLIMGSRIAAQADSSFTTPWSAADGTEHMLNASTIIAISNAVLAHVRECFTLFSSVAADIEAGTIDTPEAVRDAFA